MRFEIPQLVPLESSISISELSAATRLPEDVLARGIRYGIANGLFREVAPSQITHSAASAALASNPHLRNVVHFGTEFLQNILMKIPPTIIAQVDSTTDKVPETAFNLAYNTEENLFQYFAHSKDLNKKYHEYLMGRVNTPLWSMDRLRAAWNWSYLGQNTIVDVRCSPTVDLLNCWVDSSLDRLVDHPATQS
jgi:6-hydroxytryprostatin B O-methyltransferase